MDISSVSEIMVSAVSSFALIQISVLHNIDVGSLIIFNNPFSFLLWKIIFPKILKHTVSIKVFSAASKALFISVV